MLQAFRRLFIRTPFTRTACTLSTEHPGVISVGFPGLKSRALFHGIFLRDHCETSRHPLTGQRSIDTFELPLDLLPSRGEWQGEELHLEWPPDSTRSVFTMHWLRRHAYWWDGPPPPPLSLPQHSSKVGSRLDLWWQDEARRKDSRVVWESSTLPSPLPSLSYSDWMDSDGGLLQGLRLLRDYGFVMLQGAPVSEEATEAACLRIGFLRPTLYGPGMWRTEVLASPKDITDTAFTSAALALHTDNNYLRDPPGLQVFHCTKADAGGGGGSLLADGLAIAREIEREDPASFRLLTLWPIPYHHTGRDGIVGASRPVFELDEQGQVSGVFFNNDDRGPVLGLPTWGRELALVRALTGTGDMVKGPSPASNLLHPSTAVPALYSALRVLQGVMRRSSLTLRLRLQPGTILLFNNHRVLHGREGFHSTSGRTLVGCYIGADEWQSKIRELTLLGRGAGCDSQDIQRALYT